MQDNLILDKLTEIANKLSEQKHPSEDRSNLSELQTTLT